MWILLITHLPVLCQLVLISISMVSVLTVFYVSTNGAIALSNRRYFYNIAGVRTPPAGGQHCYDNQSMDWFVGPGGATPPGYTDRVTSRSITICDGEDGTADPIDDDFGYNVAVYKWGLSHTGSTSWYYFTKWWFFAYIEYKITGYRSFLW